MSRLPNRPSERGIVAQAGQLYFSPAVIIETFRRTAPPTTWDALDPLIDALLATAYDAEVV